MHTAVLTTGQEAVKRIQQQVFAKQIELANRFSLPLNVHSRSAGHHAIRMLVEHGAERAVLHAFDGRPHYAEEGCKAGKLTLV